MCLSPPSPHPYVPHAQPISFFSIFITRTILGEEYKSFSSSLCNLLHSPVTSTLQGPNILLNTTFCNTPSFLSSRNVNDQVSYPYKTTGKFIVPYILISKFLDSNLENKKISMSVALYQNTLRHDSEPRNLNAIYTTGIRQFEFTLK